MKSRFEIENNTDFEGLDANQRLALARLFADTCPTLIAEYARLTEALSQTSIATTNRIDAAKDRDAVVAICAEGANVMNELLAAFAGVLKTVAHNLGRGVKLICASTAATKQ